MSTYELNIDTTTSSLTYQQAEKYIYGSSRLGMLQEKVDLLGSAYSDTPMDSVLHFIGNKQYEFSNHLGNVLTTIWDKPIPHQNGSNVDYWLADIKTAQDYSPFGVILSGRNFSSDTTNYSHSFQGQLRDDEITEGYVNFTYRGYDPRIGRLNWAIDPLAGQFPWNSPYAFSENIVINAIELEGKEKEYIYDVYKKFGMTMSKLSSVKNDPLLEEYQRTYRYWNGKGEIEKTVTQIIPDYARNPNKDFIDNMIDSDWNDGHYFDSFVWMMKKKDRKMQESSLEALKTTLSFIGVVASGGALKILEGITLSRAIETGFFIFSLDELISVNDDTPLESLIENRLGTTAKGLFKGAKLAFQVKDASSAVVNFTVKLASGEFIHGAMDTTEQTLELGGLIIDLSEEVKNKGNDTKNEK